MPCTALLCRDTQFHGLLDTQLLNDDTLLEQCRKENRMHEFLLPLESACTTNILLVDFIEADHISREGGVQQTAMCTVLQIVEAARFIRNSVPSSEWQSLPKLVFAPCGTGLDISPFIAAVLLTCPASEFHFVHKHASDSLISDIRQKYTTWMSSSATKPADYTIGQLSADLHAHIGSHPRSGRPRR